MGQQPLRQDEDEDEDETPAPQLRMVGIQPDGAAGNVESGAGRDRAPIDTRVRRCLIVDDNERFLAVAQVHLSRGGLEVVDTAMSQAEASRRAKALRPDVVLVDISLGRESGFDVVRRLVEDVPVLDGSVVLISTHDGDDFADLIEASPAVGFIAKGLLSVRAIEELLSADGI
jgi:CheY-like chemotaxis protein